MNDVYSCHTFILPFVWLGGVSGYSFEKIIDVFKRNPIWRCFDMGNDYSFVKEDNIVTFYNEYQYFYPQVRNVLYGYEGTISRLFTFADEKVRNKAHYYITKGNTKYDLRINAIRVALYETGVGLFILECENLGQNGQNTLACVKNINDYGRRVTLPFIPASDAYSSCADSLEIVIPDLGFHSKCDFRNFINQVNNSDTDIEKKNLIMFDYMADFIKNILSFGSDVRFSSEPTVQKGQIHIRPALDDRMFVASCVIDKKETEKMLEKGKNESYPFESGELQKNLYEFIFVDSSGSCSCQNEAMRTDLIHGHVYSRWLDYYSIYAVTAQSFVLLTNGSAGYVIDYFLTEYVRMVCLCLAQRASLIHFQRRAAFLSEQIYKKKKQQVSSVTRLMQLQEQFSAFESQMLFSEVTPQEQGIEIYDMFQKFFFIDRETENVKTQMQGLYEAADTFLEYRFNKIGLIFTLIGGVLAFLQVLTGVMVFGSGEKLITCSGMIFIAIAAVICIVSFCLVQWRYRIRKK